MGKYDILSFLKKKITPKKRLNVFMLSPEDYAGSGCRIRDAVRRVVREDEITINLITAKRRNIGFNNSDIVLGDGDQALKEAQQLLDKADIVHFKDDNPPIDGMYGLVLPHKAKIVHTAGGSGFRRRERTPILEDNIIREIKLSLKDIGKSDCTWWLINDDESIKWNSTKDKLELNLMNYNGKNHINIRSRPVENIKGPIVICGDVLLHQTGDNSGFKICTIITEYLDDKNKVIGKNISKFGAIRDRKIPWRFSVHPKEGQKTIRFIIYSPFSDKSNFTLSNLKFLEMKKDWGNGPISEEIKQISIGLWPLETYRCADLRTVLTADLLIDDNIIFTPQAIPTSKFELVNKSNKRLIVTHAPSNRMKKGTDSIILPALERLSKRFDFEIKLIENMTHEKCLEEIQKSDIFIDQVLVGFYGNAAMEAMAFGVPIAVHLNENITKLAGDIFEYCPIIPVRERTIESFTKAIEPWLKNPETLRLQGLKSRKWVSLVHDENVVGKKWVHLYRNLFNPISRFYQLFRKKFGNYYLPRVIRKSNP
jgi:glycosyltransferase involved in cell wall biosynthesis